MIEFRGRAGEVVQTFTQPRTFLTGIPILLIWSLGAVILHFLGTHPSLIATVTLTSFIATLCIGRFALLARQGHIESGFLEHTLQWRTLFGFVLRYLILTSFWLVPIGLLTYGTLASVNGSLVFGFEPVFGPQLISAGMHGLVLVIALFTLFFAPGVMALVAAYTQQVSDLFKLSTWSWLLIERRSDIVPFYTNLLGGIFMFTAIYIIPIMIIAMLAFKLLGSVGFLIASVLYALPFMLSPILIGRLSGVFVEASISTQA